MVRKEENVTSARRPQLPEGFLERAREEARAFKHNYIATEHLLLALVVLPEGRVLLIKLGLEPEKVRSDVEWVIGRGDRSIPDTVEQDLTPRAKKVIELAIDEMRRLNHHQMQVWHVLLGLVREGEGIAAGILEKQGVTLAKAREEVQKISLTFEQQLARVMQPLYSLWDEYVQLQKQLLELGLTTPLEDLTDDQIGALQYLSQSVTSLRERIGWEIAGGPAEELFPTTHEERVLHRYVGALDAREALRRVQEALPSKE